MARDSWNFVNGATGAGGWAILNGDRQGFRRSGFIGGVQLGYMQQWGTIVAGIDVSGSLASLSRTSASAFVPAFDTFRTRQQWLALLQGRLGFAVSPNVLLFGQGGLAIAKHNISLLTTFGGVVNDSASSTRVGWTLGAGLAYKVTPNWIVGAEYNYVDFGRKTYTLTANGAPADLVSSRKSDHLFKLTVNYQFGSPAGSVVAKY